MIAQKTSQRIVDHVAGPYRLRKRSAGEEMVILILNRLRLSAPKRRHLASVHAPMTIMRPRGQQTVQVSLVFTGVSAARIEVAANHARSIVHLTDKPRFERFLVCPTLWADVDTECSRDSAQHRRRDACHVASLHRRLHMFELDPATKKNARAAPSVTPHERTVTGSEVGCRSESLLHERDVRLETGQQIVPSRIVGPP